MRGILAAILTLIMTSACYAQWNTSGTNTIHTNPGNVGVGFPTPLEKLHINGAIRGNISGGAVRINTGLGYVDIGPTNESWAHFRTDRPAYYFNKPLTVDGAISSYNSADLFLQTTNLTRLTILNSNGNVGIGLSPEGKLHVKGCAYFGNENGNSWHRLALGGSGNNYGSVGYGYKYTTTNSQHIYSVNDYASQLGFDAGGFVFRTAPSGSPGAAVNFIDVLRILQNGNVGIGTSSPDAKLTVKGHIHTQEVRVDLNGAVAPDYVFGETYILPTLEEVEAYIKTNKHLNEIPSAKEMEENGLNLKEMNLLLLKKVEELTLYIIEQDKMISKLERQQDKTESQLSEMKELISRLALLEQNGNQR